MRKIKTAASILMLALSCVLFEASASFVDCTQCHYDLDSLSKYDHDSNHVTGANYPSAPRLGSEYNAPTGHTVDIAFFDANGNGLPDADEIQLFGAGNTVECSSCHAGHEEAPPPSATPKNMYLRVGTRDSAMCLVCHRI